MPRKEKFLFGKNVFGDDSFFIRLDNFIDKQERFPMGQYFRFRSCVPFSRCTS